jgi:hypothetical protein
MSTPAYPVSRGEPARPRVDARALWMGGLATAVVAALVGIVGVLIARGLLGIAVLAPRGRGVYGDASTTQLALSAAATALAATALAHVLLLAVPRPMVFFAWIVGLTTLAAVLLPFRGTASLDAKLATAIVYLVIGLAIGTLISGVASYAVRGRAATTTFDPY